MFTSEEMPRIAEIQRQITEIKDDVKATREQVVENSIAAANRDAQFEQIAEWVQRLDKRFWMATVGMIGLLASILATLIGAVVSGGLSSD